MDTSKSSNNSEKSGALLFIAGLIVGAIAGIIIGLLVALIVFSARPAQGVGVTPGGNQPSPVTPIAPGEPAPGQPQTDPGTPATPTPTVPPTQTPRQITVYVPDRIKLESPAANTKITDKLTLNGQMKGFFEGTLNFKLLDGNGKEVYKNILNAKGDNYQAYADFSANFNLPKHTAGNGSVLFYEVSAKDGSEIRIMAVPVQL